MSIIVIIVLFAVGTLLSAMAAGYATLSTSHLRHWAKSKDPAAGKLYPLKARGSATYLTIELLRALCLSGGITVLAVTLNPVAGWLAASVLFFVGFVVLTQLYLKPFGIRLLVWFSAPLLGLTNMLKPVTLPLGRLLDGFIKDEPVTLTREELAEKLDSIQPEDTDLTHFEVQILSRALNFSKKTVHDVMIPKNRVKTIKEEEALTPFILDELHGTGHSHFPVMAAGKNVVGILHMYDGLDIASHDKTAGTIMQKVYFVDEDRDLGHVLDTFYKTKQPVFVVHNEASDMVGIITMEDVLHQVLGKPLTHARANQVQEASEDLAPVVE